MSDKPETYDDAEVDESLEETFPASDPVPVNGGSTGPDDKKPE